MMLERERESMCDICVVCYIFDLIFNRVSEKCRITKSLLCYCIKCNYQSNTRNGNEDRSYTMSERVRTR